jgi:hypothetical protein
LNCVKYSSSAIQQQEKHSDLAQKRKKKVVFLGTPGVAVQTLSQLLEASQNEDRSVRCIRNNRVTSLTPMNSSDNLSSSISLSDLSLSFCT